MIKYLSHNADTGRVTLGIVLSEGNMDRLKQNKPIHFNAEEMKLPKINVNEIVIIYMKNESEFVKWAKNKGTITEKTIVHEVKDDKNH